MCTVAKGFCKKKAPTDVSMDMTPTPHLVLYTHTEEVTTRGGMAEELHTGIIPYIVWCSCSLIIFREYSDVLEIIYFPLLIKTLRIV